MKRLAPAALAVVALGLTACSTGPTGGSDSSSAPAAGSTKTDAGAFPVQVKTALGTATIKQAPQRVVVLGWSDQDVAAALGVVPVGVPAITWGGNAAKSTDWFDAQVSKLGGSKPTQYSDADGVPFDKIAALKPDLILATNSGITKADYAKLTQLAPTVGYPGAPWATSWQDSTTLIGKALGKSAEAKKLITDTESEISTATAKYPALKGKSASWIGITPTDLSKVDVYLPTDNRPRMLSQFGMTTPSFVTDLGKKNPNAFFASVSAEKASTIDSDLVIFYVDKPGQEKSFVGNPLLGKIPALKNGSYVASSDNVAAMPMSSPTPLSIPYALDHFLPQLAKAAAKVK